MSRRILCDTQRLGPQAARLDGREFLASQARGGVELPARVGEPPGHLPEHLVSDPVAVAVVELLEVVDVDAQPSTEPPVAPRAAELGRRLALEGAGLAMPVQAQGSYLGHSAIPEAPRARCRATHRAPCAAGVRRLRPRRGRQWRRSAGMTDAQRRADVRIGPP